MQKLIKIAMGIVLFASLFGCAYRYYLGMHGPSIKNFTQVHAGVTEDHECLECHHPDKASLGPPTKHPNFTGCLKCHNDDV